MKTWILLATSTGAAVYVCDTLSRRVQLAKRISYGSSLPATGSAGDRIDRFARYLADEMAIACGSGTSAKLALYADAAMLAAIVRKLPGEVRRALVRTCVQTPAFIRGAQSGRGSSWYRPRTRSR